MKKALMILIIASAASSLSAQTLGGVKRKENVHCYSTRISNEQQKDEYGFCGDEYDQYVCDHVKPPKISAAMALLTEIGGRVLIEFIMVKEVLRRYYAELKAMLNKWYTCIVAQ